MTDTISWKEMTVEQRVEAARRLRAANPNWSSAQIANTVGCSRNAVLGLMHKNRELLGHTPAPQHRNKQTFKFGYNATSAGTPTPPKMKHRDPAFDPLPGTVPKKLEDLVVGKECRWPVTDSVTTMCGCPVAFHLDDDGKERPDDADRDGRGRYCPHHAAMSGVQLAAVA